VLTANWDTNVIVEITRDLRFKQLSSFQNLRRKGGKFDHYLQYLLAVCCQIGVYFVGVIMRLVLFHVAAKGWISGNDCCVCR